MTWRLGALAIGLAGFSVVHSVLAATRVQRSFESRGVSPRAYRLAYSCIAVAALLALLPLMRGDFPSVWQVRGAWRWVLVGVQIGALIGLVWAARGFDILGFLGARATRSGRGARPDLAPGAPASLAGPLQTRGAYALCRHPIYLFTAIFFSAWPSMDAGRFVVAVWIWAYSWIGSIFEERRLVGELGEAYQTYRATHWRLLPLGPRRRTLRPAPPPGD